MGKKFLDRAYEVAGADRFEDRISEWIGGVRLLFRQHGDHLPGIGLGSNVYAIERC